jgi:Domain of Unknown Function (DUF1080)
MSQELPNRSLPNSQSKESPQATTPTTQPNLPSKNTSLSKEVKIALIGAAAVLISAIIAGVFQLVNARITSSTPSLPITRPTTAPTPPSPSPTSATYPPSGWQLALSDPMKSNSSGYWPVEKDKMGGCEFANDVYQVSRWQVGGGHYCSPDHFNFTDFTLESQMIITKGDEGVMLFRATDTGNYYEFWISPSGTYALEIWKNNTFSKTLVSSNHKAINTGFYQPNTVAVVAQGNTFHLYVNNQLINAVTDQDSSYSHGNIYLEAYSVSNPTEVLFSNVKVWRPGS